MQRLLSLDTFRGFAMLLIAMELLDLPGLAEHFPGNALLGFIGLHSSHVEWTGCTLHDLIQPWFSFMVGVALALSMRGRAARGQSPGKMWAHALWRAFVLVALGVVLRFLDEHQVHWTFEDTLSQIGLGYPFLFALGFASTRVRWVALVVVLAGYWLLFALYPAPGPGYDYAAVNVPEGWVHHFPGFAAHWNLNANAAWAFDRWFINLFPGGDGFIGNPEGYSTLSFIPTLGTMILGLIAGQWLSRPEDRGHLALSRLVIAGALCIVTGLVLHVSGMCPSVKKLWTPSWTLFSGGWCLFTMAAFHFINDMLGWNRWGYPLRVIGANSILIYVMIHLAECYFTPDHKLYFGGPPFDAFGREFQQLLYGGTLVAIMWGILWVLYRRRIFLRI